MTCSLCLMLMQQRRNRVRVG